MKQISTLEGARCFFHNSSRLLSREGLFLSFSRVTDKGGTEKVMFYFKSSSHNPSLTPAEG